MPKRMLAAALLTTSILATPALAQTEETKLLRDPALSDNALAFVYAGDIWLADSDGSNPRRLTSHSGDERDPIFSPDGSKIAFTADYDGNDDVFVIDVRGGQPRRLTWHPGNDTAIDWAPGGDAVAMVSAREVRAGRSGQLFHVALSGGLPAKISEAVVSSGSYDESGRIFTNVPWRSGNANLTGGVNGWRGYRGGLTPSLQLIDFDGDTVTTIPGDRTTEFDPEWMDGKLYFLSDRWNTRANIFSYDPASGELAQLTQVSDWDIRAITAKNGRIVYEAGGVFHALDVASGVTSRLPITLNADLPARQPQWKNVSEQMTAAALSPSGKRVAVTARGEVFTVPADKGATRNISQSSAVRDYGAVWSEDGTELAYITDDGARQVLRIEDQTGIKPVRTIALGEEFYELIGWGNGGKHIVYASSTLQLMGMDVATGTSWQIATSPRRNGNFDAAMSPKGPWIAYTTRGANVNAELQLYNLDTRRSYAVTEGLADIGSPVFSKDGKLLFFAASTNAGSVYGGLDMTTQDRPYRAGLYAVVLEADGESPLAPILANEEADENGDADKDEKSGKDKEEGVTVDPTNLIRRTVSLPVPEAAYTSLATAKDGALFYVSLEQAGVATGPGSGQENAQLMRFDFEEREASQVGKGFTAVSTNAAGDKLLLFKSDNTLVTADAGEKLEPEPVSMSGVRMLVDPLAEWKQIFGDVHRMEQSYFYDPDMHGLDWAAVRAKFEPFLPHLGRREDLNELLVEMAGEMGVGHNYIGGGDVYDNSSASPGLLGADLAIENGRYRIKRIYSGEKWNPFVAAPLSAPGVDVKEGDYIIAINGQPLTASDNIYAALSGSAGSQIALTVASTPSGTRRTSTVEPTGNERTLRLWSWIEDNRKRVDQATNGRVAYVYMPNTAGAGYTLFNRMYFAQTDKDALILDERSNGGGQAANYIIDILSRKWLAGWKDREGTMAWSTPGGAIYGPKVMLMDQDAGSGGDWMPYAFRESGLGTLIGMRTWGGLIGISANPALIDGGTLTVPFFRFYDTDGRYTIENEGVAPDIRVELDPVALDRGQDTQLDAAIATVLRQLEDYESPVKPAPPYPTEIGK